MQYVEYVGQMLWISLLAGLCGSMDECFAEEGQDYTLQCSLGNMHNPWFTWWILTNQDETSTPSLTLSNCSQTTGVCTNRYPDKFTSRLLSEGDNYQNQLRIIRVGPDLRQTVFTCIQWDPVLRYYSQIWSYSITTYLPPESPSCNIEISPDGIVFVTCQTSVVNPGIFCQVYHVYDPSLNSVGINSSLRTKTAAIEVLYTTKSGNRENSGRTYHSSVCTTKIHLVQSGSYGLFVLMKLNATQETFLSAGTITLPLSAIGVQPMPHLGMTETKAPASAHTKVIRSKRDNTKEPHENQNVTLTVSSQLHNDTTPHIIAICVLAGIILCFAVFFAMKKFWRLRGQCGQAVTDPPASAMRDGPSTGGSSNHTYETVESLPLGFNRMRFTWSDVPSHRYSGDVTELNISSSLYGKASIVSHEDGYITPCTPRGSEYSFSGAHSDDLSDSITYYDGDSDDRHPVGENIYITPCTPPSSRTSLIESVPDVPADISQAGTNSQGGRFGRNTPFYQRNSFQLPPLRMPPRSSVPVRNFRHTTVNQSYSGRLRPLLSPRLGRNHTRSTINTNRPVGRRDHFSSDQTDIVCYSRNGEDPVSIYHQIRRPVPLRRTPPRPPPLHPPGMPFPQLDDDADHETLNAMSMK